MIDSIQKQLGGLTTKYGWLGTSAVKNMRLLLLLLFAGLSAYLVFRINSLVNAEVVASTDESVAISRKLDEDVLSLFNELYVQDVQLDSNFDDSRQNPF